MALVMLIFVMFNLSMNLIPKSDVFGFMLPNGCTLYAMIFTQSLFFCHGSSTFLAIPHLEVPSLPDV
jgi:hypothetical protein